MPTAGNPCANEGEEFAARTPGGPTYRCSGGRWVLVSGTPGGTPLAGVTTANRRLPKRRGPTTRGGIGRPLISERLRTRTTTLGVPAAGEEPLVPPRPVRQVFPRLGAMRRRIRRR